MTGKLIRVDQIDTPIERDEELVAMIPPETRIELERFAEIYV